MVIVQGNIPVIPHASEKDGFPFFKATVQGFIATVPFTGMECIIAGFLKGFTYHRVRIRDCCSLFFEVIKIFSGH